MTDQSETEAPRIYPTMRCRDAEAMIRWLKDVIGFTEYVVYRKAARCNMPNLPTAPRC